MQSPLHRPLRTKILVSLLILGMALLAAFSTIDQGIESLLGPPENRIDGAYYSRTLSRCAYTFAIVRGINGVISVIQGTDVSVSPAGVGLTLAAGEILDPVNDLAERFSWVMLMATTSVGIQMVLMEMGEWFGFKILLSTALLLSLIGLWQRKILGYDLQRAGGKMLLVAFIVRLGFPVMAVAGEAIYRGFLEQRYEAAVRSLQEIDQTLQSSDLLQAPKEGGYLKRVMGAVNVAEKVNLLKERISDYAEYTVTLITIFLLQTVFFPLFFLWLFLHLIRGIYAMEPFALF